MKSRLVPLLALIAASLTPAAAQNGKPDSEGFIRDWLVLGPLSIAGSTGMEEIDKKQLPNEAQPAAKANAKEKVGGAELAWEKITAPQFYIDFREVYPDRSDFAVAWAVAYIVSPDEKSGLTLRMNSNDQGKVYLNGKEVVKFVDARTLDKGSEDAAAAQTLKKGVNVLVLKVINEENNWQGSVRFLDSTGKPITDLKVQTEP